LEQDVGLSTLFLGDGPVSTILEDNVRGCDDARVVGGVLDEDEEEEEEEVPLIQKIAVATGATTFRRRPYQHLSAFSGC
jgi:hypothetical protein